jgi:NAD(P)-dependent dehydrogenase (short-subunit alcohol dehydrogenase family)
MTGKLSGKVAVVTGGTDNLGKLFAESLAGDGANLVLHYNSPRREQQAADVVCASRSPRPPSRNTTAPSRSTPRSRSSS